MRLLRAYLEQAGYHVVVAYDGETVLHAIRSEKPDLVVLDLMLPERDGWEITHIMRNDELLAGTPIIMLTARIEDTDKITGLELEADDYVPKPFNPREVVADIAHELRTPLTVIQGNLQAILDDVYPLEKREIVTVYDETIVLGRLVSDLRDLSQAEARQLNLNIQPTAVHPTVDGVRNATSCALLHSNLAARQQSPPVVAGAGGEIRAIPAMDKYDW